MKEWGILPEDTGYVEGRLISDTKEIVFDPDHARFSIHTPYCGYFSGAPEEEISLSDKICVEAENERITLALIAKDEIKMDGASEYILTAMGTTGMDETTFGKGPELMGIPFAAVESARRCAERPSCAGRRHPRCAGAAGRSCRGGSAAAHGLRRKRPVGRLGLPRADLPRRELPVRPCHHPDPGPDAPAAQPGPVFRHNLPGGHGHLLGVPAGPGGDHRPPGGGVQAGHHPVPH